MLGSLATTRSPARDRVMVLLAMKAGLRAKEMASRTWAMVTKATGQVEAVLHVPNRASTGKAGGRTMPLHPDFQAALRRRGSGCPHASRGSGPVPSSSAPQAAEVQQGAGARRGRAAPTGASTRPGSPACGGQSHGSSPCGRVSG